MKRIQGSFGSRDPEEERRKARESVLSSLLVFTVLVAGIKAAPHILSFFH